MRRTIPLLFGVVLAAALVRPKKQKASSAPRLPDGTPRAQILFFHTPWCPACQKAKPELSKIAKRHPRIVFTYIDIEKDPQTASEFSVSSIPTFIALIDGKEVDRREGFKDGTDLETFVSDAMMDLAIETPGQKALEA